MDPSECSYLPDMKAFESHSESEFESDSTQEIKDGQPSCDDNLKVTKLNQNENTEKEENKYEENSLGLPSMAVKVDQTSDKDKSQLKEREESSLVIKERHSHSEQNKEVLASDHKEETLLKESEENPHVSKQIHSLPIIEEDQTLEKNKESRLEEREERPIALVNEDQTSKKKEESRLKEREDRPLVLEARHSLSIAETKKRRASVYCDGNLFIPKELARSGVHQRRYSSAVNTLDQISRNRDYCIRMLKFPVGSGRARYVAQQLRRKKSKERKMRTEVEFGVNLESRIKEEAPSVPNLNSEQADNNQLYSDDECCIVLEEIVDANGTETEHDGTDELIERVSERQLKRASSLEIRCNKNNELVVEIQDQQHLPVFRWHIPDCNESSIKMGLMEDLSNMNAESQVGFTEVDATATVAEVEQRVSVREIREEAPEVELQQQSQQQQQSIAGMEQEQHTFQVEHTKVNPQQHQLSQSQQRVAAVPSHLNSIESQVVHTMVNPQQQQLQLQHQISQGQQHVAAVPSHLNSIESQVKHSMANPQQQQQLQLQHQLSQSQKHVAAVPSHLDSIESQVKHATVNPQQQQQQQQQLQLQLQHQLSQSQQHVAAVPSHLDSIESQVVNSPLRQHLMHRIILPSIHTDELPQSNRVNNNQNLQQHYVESLVPSELLQQWSKEQYGKYAFLRTAPQEQQLSHTLQQQQSDYLWQQQQYQTSYQEQQHLEARREELQQLNEHYQRLKSQEDEKLKSINKSLKDIYADRLISERQHADYHRMFMLKMVESKKQEETLQAQKEHIKRQLMAELGNLEQQFQERNRIWQWQQQQYQQQKQQYHNLQQQQHQIAFDQQHHQQQYFLRQLQPPAYQSSLQCFQEAPITHSGFMAPPLPAPPPPPPPSPPPTVYRGENLQSAVTLESNARSERRIMPRRHTIDHRVKNMMIYAHPTSSLQSLAQPPRHSLRRTHATSTNAMNPPPAQQHFAISNDSRTQVNQAIEQTAITSIISNYVTNYLNDMESRHP